MNYGDDLFKGTAWYYSRFRPIYPSYLFRFLVNKFSLDGQGNMLDLGCGTGEIASRLYDWFESIIGIDMEYEMLNEAKEFKEQARIPNIEYFNGDLHHFISEMSVSNIKLVTMAKSFHWMNREEVLEKLYNLIIPGGGVAIIDNYIPNKEFTLWENKVKEVISKWYGDKRKAGNTIYAHPDKSHASIIENSKFKLEIHNLPSYKYRWTVDSILGNIYSTSYGAKRFLGDNISGFENELRNELLKINNLGLFEEDINISVKLALKV